ncbi:MAG TPA: DUF1634 domain-containing protein [Candidatus Limnocylindrales bacterium]|nr:DUF1634 domain-containing protein [Candidatus Limnocylindrales bacterium]
MIEPGLVAPERRWTNLAYTVGTTAAAACLLVGLLLQAAGQPADAGDPLDLGAIAGDLGRLRPWGWTMLGVIVLLLTPPAGLLATFVELRAFEPRVALLGLTVMGVLALAVVVALR